MKIYENYQTHAIIRICRANKKINGSRSGEHTVFRYYIPGGDVKRFERKSVCNRIVDLVEKDSDDRLSEDRDPLIFLFAQQILIIAYA